jgi:hypothetical protein
MSVHATYRLRDGSVVSSLHGMNDPQPEGHMASYIERRKFLATLGGAAAWPRAVRAQQARKVHTIGFLSPSTAAFTYYSTVLFNALRELGWIEGAKHCHRAALCRESA